MQKLILIDAHAIIHRAYHALPPLTSPSGESVGAVYGFTVILMRILREFKARYIAAAFDLPGPTFRHLAYERYKAQRPETPSDLASQFIKVKEVLQAFGIPIFEKEGYEADDIIGTIARKLEKKKDIEIVVLTGDLDTLQLIRPRLKVYSMKKGITETIIYDEKAVRERYGLKPLQLADFKGLKGDPSDNIPGVKGIGEKTATELIQKFGSIEKLYAALKRDARDVSESLAAKLREGEEAARLSKELASIKTEAPLEFELKKLRWEEKKDTTGIQNIFQKLGFFSLLRRLTEGGPQMAQRPLLTVKAKALFPARFQDFTAADARAIKDAALLLQEDELYILVRDSQKVFRIVPPLLREAKVKEFLERSNFWVYDGKSIIKFLRRYGVPLGGISFDLAIAAYLAGSILRDFSYLGIASRELGRMVSPDPRKEFIHFFEIARLLRAKLAIGRLEEVFEKIELPLVEILADMEGWGIKIDVRFLKELSKKIEKDLASLTREIYRLAGGPFNINSPQQLAVVLFEKLNLKTYGLRKTAKEGRISTGAAELVKLKSSHPIVGKILEHRELMKLKTTYVDALPPLVNPQTGRLHTTFNQTGTATGRLSSSDPNLQNIPIMSELGREIRKAFVAESGFLFLSFDYSQIELRVAAHLAGDKKMIEAFGKGLDIHKMTAAEIFNMPLERVGPEERRAAKTLNFGILYGMGPQSLAESTGMSRDEARRFIDEYFHDFSDIKHYIDNTLKFVGENGYVETLFGRRRFIPEIYSPNWQLKREAERMAINAPIQGTAADLAKLAMIKADEWIRKEKLENEVRPLLQVHDELLFEIKEDLIKKAAPQIKEIMEGAAELQVPLVVDVKYGQNWGEQKEI